MQEENAGTYLEEVAGITKPACAIFGQLHEPAFRRFLAGSWTLSERSESKGCRLLPAYGLFSSGSPFGSHFSRSR